VSLAASPAPSPLPEDLRAQLVSIVGDAHVLVDPELTAGFTADWTGRFRGATPAVVRPGSTAEVAAVLAACQRSGVAVVPQGGNTGLVGGSVPLHGEAVLSLRRLDAVGEVDRAAGQITVGAGVTLGRLQEAARDAGFVFGVDLGARDSATVGGMIATNAGGLRFLRYGGMRDQVLGLEAVLADGRVLSHLDGLWKDNTGYDWGRLLCGSEGTLAVITRARLRLAPAPAEVAVALLAFESVAGAVEATWALRGSVADLSAAEVFFDGGLRLVCEQLGLLPPFPQRYPAYLLVEAAGLSDPLPALAAAVEGLAGLGDAAVADSAGRAAALWGYRERHPEAVNLLGAPHKLDVTLPAAALAHFVETVSDVVHDVDAAAAVWLFGHVADGNIHVNITGPGREDERTDEAVLRYVASLGGSISAEHGIGTAKRAFLHLNRSPEELAVFGAIRNALDPTRMLNPHVLV
jgi:FAD/FMN-containing dehydrogenase